MDVTKPKYNNIISYGPLSVSSDKTVKLYCKLHGKRTQIFRCYYFVAEKHFFHNEFHTPIGYFSKNSNDVENGRKRQNVFG